MAASPTAAVHPEHRRAGQITGEERAFRLDQIGQRIVHLERRDWRTFRVDRSAVFAVVG
jgi:hypothetical protein